MHENILTERLTLRPFTLDDTPALFVLGTHPLLIRYTGNKPMPSLDAARNVVQNSALSDYQTYGYGRLACVDNASGHVIGFCGVKYLPEIEENELGYRFLPDYWGKGIATEAAMAVMLHARDELKLKRLVSLIHPENNASKRVVEKCGFCFEKRMPFALIEDTDVEVFQRAF